MQTQTNGTGNGASEALTTLAGEAIYKPSAITEDRLASEITSFVQQQFRYVGAWSRWSDFNGVRWTTDNKISIIESIRVYLRHIATAIRTGLTQWAKSEAVARGNADKAAALLSDADEKSSRIEQRLLSLHTILSVERLMRSDARVSADVDIWDSDPWLLNTPDGTVDLRTGAMHRHKPSDFITMQTAVGPKAGTPHKWLAFLKTIMHDNQSMVDYLQKVFGYALAGETTEHQMYFAYGTGANGKSVTINTMRNLMGMYGKTSQIETFTSSDTQRHPTELANLRGSRLVTCGETDAGTRWAEARIKMLTGDDAIQARFLYQDFFEFKPQFKLFIAGNHKPKLTNIDEALQRRFRLIPFTYTVPTEQRDIFLSEKLRSEWPMILHWAIEGALRWQREGLEPPEIVSGATKSYLNQQDNIMMWLAECTIFGAGGSAFTPLQDLFDSWQKWARTNAEEPMGKNKFSQALEDREPVLKILKARRAGGMGFLGIELAKPGSNK